MNKFWLHSAFVTVTMALFFACSGVDKSATSALSAKDKSTTLEDTVEEGSTIDWIMQAKTSAQQTVTAKSLEQMKQQLIPHETVYIPEQGKAPFPVLLFMHGCSGSTPAHEQDWAKRFNNIGVAVIGIDSYAGREIDWNDACNFKKMTPWERSSDIPAIIDSLKDRNFADPKQIYLTGFSHGALTIWAFLEQLSNNKTPLSLTQLPENNYQDAIKGTFMFYGSCPNATHTFDHANPNQANIEAGSRYNEAATMHAWRRIKGIIEADGNAQ